MASAPEQVSDTVELIEMILLKLPARDILLAQRVSKQWQAVIKSSTKLQQALFFQPIVINGMTPLWMWYRCKSADHQPTGILLVADRAGEVHAGESSAMFKNPLIRPLLDCFATVNFSETGSVINALPPSWHYADASRRQMILTQPSMKTHVYWYEPTLFEDAWIEELDGEATFALQEYSDPKSGVVDFESGRDRHGEIVEKLERDLISHYLGTVEMRIMWVGRSKRSGEQ